MEISFGSLLGQFKLDQNKKTSKFYRYINEIPTLLLILIEPTGTSLLLLLIRIAILTRILRLYKFLCQVNFFWIYRLV